MWRYRAIILIALVAVTQQQISITSIFQQGSNWGPWIQPTEGEVWPMPNWRMVKEDYKLLSLSEFRFQVIGETCDIVTKAVERYMGILLTDAKVAGLVDEKQSPRTSVRDNPYYRGYLSTLNINLAKPCEVWPYLYMNETYKLEINETSSVAVLWAESVWGILRGLETFSQLCTPSVENNAMKVKCQTIVDWPQLPHRGLLLDTSRHYIPVPDILLTLDAMSYNKMNVFHWHMTDDNSFPYQSTTYPELSAKGAYHCSQIYDHKNVTEIIEYARQRGIRVIPEFDTPAHTRSWGMAHPELLTMCYDPSGKPNGKLGPMNPTNPEVYDFMRNLLSETVLVFPDKYLHLGGDEVPFDCWASNPAIRKYMLDHMYTLQDLVNKHFTELFNISDSLNAKCIVWQEVFDNGVKLPPTTVVHVWNFFLSSWQIELQKVTAAGYHALLSACWYLDIGLLCGLDGDWIRFYECNPFDFIGAANVKHLILGGEACMWSAFVNQYNMHPRIWPRACAAAERLWSINKQDNNEAARRLEEHTCRMNRRNIPAQPPNGPGFCPGPCPP